MLAASSLHGYGFHLHLWVCVKLINWKVMHRFIQQSKIKGNSARYYYTQTNECINDVVCVAFVFVAILVSSCSCTAPSLVPKWCRPRVQFCLQSKLIYICIYCDIPYIFVTQQSSHFWLSVTVDIWVYWFWWFLAEMLLKSKQSKRCFLFHLTCLILLHYLSICQNVEMQISHLFHQMLYYCITRLKQSLA